jgi:hypothetical protein
VGEVVHAAGDALALAGALGLAQRLLVGGQRLGDLALLLEGLRLGAVVRPVVRRGRGRVGSLRRSFVVVVRARLVGLLGGGRRRGLGGLGALGFLNRRDRLRCGGRGGGRLGRRRRGRRGRRLGDRGRRTTASPTPSATAPSAISTRPFRATGTTGTASVSRSLAAASGAALVRTRGGGASSTVGGGGCAGAACTGPEVSKAVCGSSGRASIGVGGGVWASTAGGGAAASTGGEGAGGAATSSGTAGVALAIVGAGASTAGTAGEVSQALARSSELSQAVGSGGAAGDAWLPVVWPAIVDASTEARPVGVRVRARASLLGRSSSAAQNGQRVPRLRSRTTSGGRVRPQRVQGVEAIAPDHRT